MQYFEKRYYDNRIGRFTTEDPVFWEVGRTNRPGQYYTDPQQWNSYSYVRNNPINYTDPSGEAAQFALVIGGATYTLSLGETVMIAGTIFIVQQNSEGAIQLLKAANDIAVDRVISTSTAAGSWYSNTYSPWAAQLGDYVYDKVHGDEDNSDSDSNSQAVSSGGSPSPGNGGGKKDGKGDNRGSNRNTTPAKDYAQIAKEKGMKETKEFGTIKGQKIYQLGNKYYSPEKTSHNTDMGWKVFEKGGGRLNRIGTADKNLNIFKK